MNRLFVIASSECRNNALEEPCKKRMLKEEFWEINLVASLTTFSLENSSDICCPLLFCFIMN
jgi:hypothetical protein